MYKTKAYSAASATSLLASTTIPRRDPTERDVQIEILFCGTTRCASVPMRSSSLATPTR
jgi:D-arabinose 1-dehydrogenase-like Zn-dependent alcohol dehydrogenase